MNILAAHVILGTIFSLAVSCSDTNKTSKLTMKVKNTGTSQSLAAVEASLPLVATTESAGKISFTPESYRLYISTIVLQNDSGLSNQFYICNTSEADCEVDFADATSIAAFEAKLNEIAITEGTYTKVWLSCSPNSNGGGCYRSC